MRILIVQTSFLGDTILSTPILSALNKLYPQAEIYTLSTKLSAQILQRDPLIKEALVYDKRGADAGVFGIFRMARKLKQFQFDRAYVLHRSWRSSLMIWLTQIPFRVGFKQARLSFLYHRLATSRRAHKHEVMRNLSLLEGEAINLEEHAELRLFAPSAQALSPEVAALNLETRPFVALFPGSAWRTKMWKWQGYREVAQHFLQQGLCVVLLGSAAEAKVAAKVAAGVCLTNLVGKASITDTLFLVSKARLIVCNDSMALHMASAFKVPTVTVFCSTLPEFGFGPWRNSAEVLERKDLECRPCGRHGHGSCPTGTQACMNDISALQVIGAANRLLGAK